MHFVWLRVSGGSVVDRELNVGFVFRQAVRNLIRLKTRAHELVHTICQSINSKTIYWIFEFSTKTVQQNQHSLSSENVRCVKSTKKQKKER